MDVTSFHYDESIFSRFNDNKICKWFDTSTSWKLKYKDGIVSRGRRKLFGTNINYPVQLTDSWHFCKTMLIVFVCLAIVVYSPVINWWVDLIVLGTIWNITFSLFYNKIFR
jgi:hypothetical protein